MPTVDAVEVVRCKDCKYFEGDWWVGSCHLERWSDGWANYPSPTVTEDGFCAWGERKEDAKTNTVINTGDAMSTRTNQSGMNYYPNCGAKMDEGEKDVGKVQNP